MKAVFIIVNDLSKFDDVLQTLVTHKVKGATILESEGLARAVLRSEGLHSLMKDLFESDKTAEIGTSKTVFTVIKDELVEEVTAAIEDVLSHSTARVKGFMFTVPVSSIQTFR